MPDLNVYRGRLAPSPTGLLHLGHARTFWTAYERCLNHHGTLVLRNEDLDVGRVKQEYSTAQLEDLAWFGIAWTEGPDKGGPHSPYNQSQRIKLYEAALEKLKSDGHVYPCSCTRKDIASAISAPHQGIDEPIYPGTCRHKTLANCFEDCQISGRGSQGSRSISWRFRVPMGREITFIDGKQGPQSFACGKDLGDFVVWRGVDNMPSYQLSCVVDDAAMEITEVVRGADLLASTARQILLYEALDLKSPSFYHTELVLDDSGVRLAKRTDALSLRSIRDKGIKPESIRLGWGAPSGVK
jgi:glutamyl-tRNA synthetase